MKPISANQLFAGVGLTEAIPVTDVVTDSRKVTPGCVFVCFPGERVDGHNYAAGAFATGAAFIVANHPVEGVPAERTVLVRDSAHAMVRMAGNYRMLFDLPVIGLTGSVGKTTTKEFTAAVLAAFGETLKTEGNHNNEIGVPMTLFGLEDRHRYAVIEMGMDHAGEIDRLTRCVRPAAGIITNIGVSHLENLGSRENILKAKLELCNGMGQGAPLALNGDDALLCGASLPGRLRPVWYAVQNPDADVRAVHIAPAPQGGTDFTLTDKAHGDFAVHIPTVGVHTVYDALAAYTAATRLGLDAARAAAALANYQVSGMRQNVVKRGAYTIIEDCYNASPDSMRAALSVLQSMPGRHVALLADMLELGSVSEAAHAELGVQAAQAGVELLVTYGERAAATAQAAAAQGVTTVHCKTQRDVVDCLVRQLCPGDALLVKGSNGMRLAEVLHTFYAEQNLEEG